MINNCRACLSPNLFNITIKEESLKVCGECFLVSSEISSNQVDLPARDLAENICVGFNVDTDRYTLTNTKDFNLSASVKLLHDKTQYLSYTPLLDNYFTRIYNKFYKEGILAIELFPTNIAITYFKNISARPYNYFSTKSIKSLVERNGLFLLSALYLSSPSHGLFFIGKSPHLYKELHNIDAIIAYETSIGVYNLQTYKDMQKFYKKDNTIQY